MDPLPGGYQNSRRAATGEGYPAQPRSPQFIGLRPSVNSYGSPPRLPGFNTGAGVRQPLGLRTDMPCTNAQVTGGERAHGVLGPDGPCAPSAATSFRDGPGPAGPQALPSLALTMPAPARAQSSLGLVCTLRAHNTKKSLITNACC